MGKRDFMIGVRHTAVLVAGLALTIGSVTAVSQQRPYRVSPQQVKDGLNRIDARAATFRLSFARAIERSRLRGSRAADEIDRSVDDLKQATARLRDRLNDRQSDANADGILEPATIIDTFMAANQLDASVQRDWQELQRELEALARMYGVTWNRTGSQTPLRSNSPSTTGANTGALNRRLGGTYQLDSGRGDDPRLAAEQATRAVPPGQRDRAYQRLMSRLEAPDVIAIDRQGNQVSMATSRGPRVTFDADDRLRTEEAGDGRRLHGRAVGAHHHRRQRQ
jgi:hypothetical protein